MASIKQRKSKGKARTEFFHWGIDDYVRTNPAYDLRKAQFASLPPAKELRPLRAIRSKYQQALAAWDRALNNGKSGALFPHGPEHVYKLARRWARQGDGQGVHFLSRI